MEKSSTRAKQYSRRKTRLIVIQLALTLVFGAFAFADGVFGLVAAVRNIRGGDRWGWLMFSGILGIATGVVVVFSPFVATLVLATFLWASIAFWSVFSGALEIAAAIRLRKEINGEIWLILSGLLSVVLGVVVTWMLLTRPVETMNTTISVRGCSMSSSTWRSRAPVTLGATTSASRLVARAMASLVCRKAASTSVASWLRSTGGTAISRDEGRLTNESTNSRYPRLVGTRPADVCGCIR